MLTISWVSGPDVGLFGQTLGSGVAGSSSGTTSISVPLGQILKGYLEAGRQTTPPSKDSDSYLALKVLLSPGAPSSPTPPVSAAVGPPSSVPGPTVITATLNGTVYSSSSGNSLPAVLGTLADAGQGVQRLTLNLTLAQIQALGASPATVPMGTLPANARIIGTPIENVAVTGGALSAVTVSVGKTGTTTDIVNAQSVFTTHNAVATAGAKGYAGSPYGGNALIATITATGDTFANATAGSIDLDILYAIVP